MLGLTPGDYAHHVGSLHLYEADRAKVETWLDAWLDVERREVAPLRDEVSRYHVRERLYAAQLAAVAVERRWS